MAAYQIDVQVNDAFASHVEPDALARVAHLVLECERQPQGMGLTLVICDDEVIRALNRDYRKVDRPTDVLSFPSGEGGRVYTAR